MVKAEPATPAMPQPRPKVMRSTIFVLMPTAPAMTRFWITARTFLPQPDLYIRNQTPKVISSVSPITNRPLIGTSMMSVRLIEPRRYSGKVTPTSRAPNTER